MIYIDPPKQAWLFNYMDPAYDATYDNMDSEDMDSSDYDELLSSSTLSAEYNAYLDSLDE